MDTSGYTDRFVANAIIGMVVACQAVILVRQITLWQPLTPSPAMQLALAAASAAFLLLALPPLVCRVMRRWRPPDPTIRQAAWRGRLTGLVFGLPAGMALVSMR
ncbi:hypothetical protein [Paraburkholderia kururiensis]|jgi:hypothetical protein|uniref:hypothetical protein n=1 Tax=Paraburkholderia kururiensis TaxID=984307 RepID=UPI0018F5728E|nr:hypothetical protein [Paraburkholderia kururiensis]